MGRSGHSVACTIYCGIRAASHHKVYVMGESIGGKDVIAVVPKVQGSCEVN